MSTSSLSRILLFAVCIAASILPADARKARAIFVQPPDQAAGKAALFTGKEYLEIELPRRNFSPEVDLPAGDLNLAILPGQLAPDSEVPAGAPKIHIPEAWSRCLLLFLPDPSNKVFPARVIPVNASGADFQKGHTLVFNASTAAIMGNFGGQSVKVLPGKFGIMKEPVSGFGAYPVDIACVFPGDAKPTYICRSSWQHDPEARQILFVTPAPGYKIPRVWGILDHQRTEDSPKN
ncbi:MAG: hypothetical protein RLZZ505_1641 [Verrucomicrobiota bacterium]|jgi:hypothetical protein